MAKTKQKQLKYLHSIYASWLLIIGATAAFVTGIMELSYPPLLPVQKPLLNIVVGMALLGGTKAIDLAMKLLRKKIEKW